MHAVRTGNLLYLAGKGPRAATGKVGAGISVEEAYGHAREVGLVLISVMREELGSLDRVSRIVKVLGMVNAVPEFGQQPAVINGCSDLFVEVFGEKGSPRAIRLSVGIGGRFRAGFPSRSRRCVEVVRCRQAGLTFRTIEFRGGNHCRRAERAIVLERTAGAALTTPASVHWEVGNASRCSGLELRADVVSLC